MGTVKIVLVAVVVIMLVLSVIVGLLCGASGFVLSFVFNGIVEEKVNDQVVLEEGNMAYEQLKQPSIPVYKSYYFFNLTNPEEFQQGLAKPSLQEIGPYTFRERRRKYYQDSHNTSVLNYTQTVHYHYDSSNSGSHLSQQDLICTINIPAVAGVYAVEGNFYYTKVFKSILNATSSGLYTCHTVSRLLWGYTDSLLESLYELGFSPTKIAYMQTNGSADDSKPSMIYTGIHDITKLAQYIQWDGHTHYVDTWPGGDKANAIRGTEGALFRPNLHVGDSLELFVGDLMRSFDLVNTGTAYHFGFRTLRYQFSASTYKGAFTEPENSMWGSWCPDGMFYIGAIKDPLLPIYASKPHFLDGDESLLEGLDGLSPCSTCHDSHIDVEPHVGVNLDFSMKLQFNVRLNISSEFSFLKNLQGVDESGSLFFPVFYLDQHAEFSEEIKEYLVESGLNEVISMEGLVSKVVNILVGVSIGSGVVSLLLILCLLCMLCSSLRKKRKLESKPLLTPGMKVAAAEVNRFSADKLSK